MATAQITCRPMQPWILPLENHSVRIGQPSSRQPILRINAILSISVIPLAAHTWAIPEWFLSRSNTNSTINLDQFNDLSFRRSVKRARAFKIVVPDTRGSWFCACWGDISALVGPRNLLRPRFLRPQAE